MTMPFEFLDIAPALPVSVALIYLFSFTPTWNHVLPSWTFGAVNDVGVDRQSHQSDEEANMQDPSSLSARNRTLGISSFLFHMGHWYLTTSKLFSNNQTCSIDVCLGQLGLVGAEIAVYYYRNGIWVQHRLILLATAWACMVIRSLWPTRNTVFDEGLSLIIAMTAIRAILPQTLTLDAKESAMDQATSKSSSTPSTSGSEKNSQPLLVHMHIFSVSLLLVFLFKTHHIFEKLPGSPVCQNVCMLIFLLVFRDAIKHWHEASKRGQDFKQNVLAYLHRAYTSIPQYIREGVLRPLSGLAPLFVCGAMTSFLTSCLGFRNLVLGLPRTGPCFRDGGMLGAIVYMVVACVNLLSRSREIGEVESLRMARFNKAVLAAFGQTVSGFVGIAGVLCVLRGLGGSD